MRSLLCEGGPTLNATLFAAALVDELFLTLAPARSPARASADDRRGPPLPSRAELELVTRRTRPTGHLFMRYRVVALSRAETPAACSRNRRRPSAMK